MPLLNEAAATIPATLLAGEAAIPAAGIGVGGFMTKLAMEEAQRQGIPFTAPMTPSPELATQVGAWLGGKLLMTPTETEYRPETIPGTIAEYTPLSIPAVKEQYTQEEYKPPLWEEGKTIFKTPEGYSTVPPFEGEPTEYEKKGREAIFGEKLTPPTLTDTRMLEARKFNFKMQPKHPVKLIRRMIRDVGLVQSQDNIDRVGGIMAGFDNKLGTEEVARYAQVPEGLVREIGVKFVQYAIPQEAPPKGLPDPNVALEEEAREVMHAVRKDMGVTDYRQPVHGNILATMAIAIKHAKLGEKEKAVEDYLVNTGIVRNWAKEYAKKIFKQIGPKTVRFKGRRFVGREPQLKTSQPKIIGDTQLNEVIALRVEELRRANNFAGPVQVTHRVLNNIKQAVDRMKPNDTVDNLYRYIRDAGFNEKWSHVYANGLIRDLQPKQEAILAGMPKGMRIPKINVKHIAKESMNRFKGWLETFAGSADAMSRYTDDTAKTLEQIYPRRKKFSDEERMRKEPVKHAKPNEQPGVFPSIWKTLASGLEVILKPSPSKSYRDTISPKTVPDREVLTYVIWEKIGKLGIVPLTIYEKVGTRKGSAQRIMPNSQEAKHVISNEAKMAEINRHIKGDAFSAAIANYVFGNTDGHARNFLIQKNADSSYKLWVIDNGLNLGLGDSNEGTNGPAELVSTYFSVPGIANPTAIIPKNIHNKFKRLLSNWDKVEVELKKISDLDDNVIQKMKNRLVSIASSSRDTLIKWSHGWNDGVLTLRKGRR